MEEPLASVPQRAAGRQFDIDTSSARLKIGELLFLCQVILLLMVVPILVIVSQRDAYLVSLVIAQMLFGFVSYPGVGQVSVRTRIALVLTLPFAFVALAIWLHSMVIASCAALPLIWHMIARVAARICVPGARRNAARYIGLVAVGLQGQLWLMLPRDLNLVNHSENANFIGMAGGIVLIGVVTVGYNGNLTMRLLALAVLIVEILLFVGVYVALPSWLIPAAFILLGLTGLVKSIEKFRSREHRAARLIQENIGIPSSAKRLELVEKIERVVCNDDLKGDCAICLTPFENGETLRRLPCGHIFCEECIRTWLLGAQMPVCPNCRALVAPAQLDNPSSV